MNRFENLKAIIFDCDGVLVDTEWYFINGLITYLKKKGFEVSIDDLSHYIGVPLPGIVKMMINEFNLGDVTDEINNHVWENDMVMNRPNELVPMDGLIEFVDWAHRQGLKLAVGSASPRNYVHQVLNAFNILDKIDAYVTIDDVKQGKPAPDVYNSALLKLGVDKENTIIVEDSPIGIMAGKAAKVFVIGFKGSRIKQDTSGANLSVNSYEELKKLIEGE